MSGAAVTGGVLALGGSVLLLFATFLPLIEIDGFIDSSVTIWDATSRPSEVFIPLLVAIAVNSLYFAFGSSGGRRIWAIVALGINITVMYYLLAQIVGLDVEGTGPGFGFYTMVLAAICIVIGCIVGIVSPQKRRDFTSQPQTTMRPPPPPTRGLSEQLRELKTLLDDGLITQDEYDTRRKRILDS